VSFRRANGRRVLATTGARVRASVRPKIGQPVGPLRARGVHAAATFTAPFRSAWLVSSSSVSCIRPESDLEQAGRVCSNRVRPPNRSAGFPYRARFVVLDRHCAHSQQTALERGARSPNLHDLLPYSTIPRIASAGFCTVAVGPDQIEPPFPSRSTWPFGVAAIVFQMLGADRRVDAFAILAQSPSRSASSTRDIFSGLVKKTASLERFLWPRHLFAFRPVLAGCVVVAQREVVAEVRSRSAYAALINKSSGSLERATRASEVTAPAQMRRGAGRRPRSCQSK